MGWGGWGISNWEWVGGEAKGYLVVGKGVKGGGGNGQLLHWSNPWNAGQRRHRADASARAPVHPAAAAAAAAAALPKIRPCGGGRPDGNLAGDSDW